MTLISYLLWSGCGIALFYLLDILLLRSSNWLKFQRWYYLGAILVSLLIPLVSLIYSPFKELIGTTSLPQITIEYQVATPIEGANIPAQETIQKVGSFTWWVSALQIIWIIGLLFSAIKLLGGWFTIRRIINRSEKIDWKGAELCLLDEEVAPFTFFNHIVISKSLMNSPIFESIIRHEMEHIRQNHYKDLLLGVLLQLLHWWNPFAWSLLHSQRDTLEYLADQGVLSSGVERKQYQFHLLEGTVGPALELPLLSFSVHNIKKRIIMMNNQKKSNRWAILLCCLSAFAIAPVLLLGSQMVHATPTSTNYAVTHEITDEPPVPDDTPESDSEESFEFPKEMPYFPGGGKKCLEWIAKNTKYPKEAVENRIQGKVYVSFVVEKDGSLSDIKIVRGADTLLDEEALRIIKSMPKWIPGKNDKGELMRCRFTQPVVFKLDNDQNKSEPEAQ